MTEFMFGDDPEMPPLEEGPDDEYDELNDETFGGDFEGDWQDTHEKFSAGFGNTSFEDDYSTKRPHDSGCYTGERARMHEENLEESISKLVLDDEDDEDDMYTDKSSAKKSQPITIGNGASMGNSNMAQLFGPSSPPALFDPQEFISPGSRKNIWGSPTTKKVTTNTEQHLKAMLNIHPPEELPLEDPAVIQAIASTEPAKKVLTLEELEKDLTDRAPPQRTVSPILGSPPASRMMPVGTPPQHSLLQRTPAGVVHQHQQQLKRQQQQQQQVMQHLQSKSSGQPMTPQQQQQQLAASPAVQQLVQKIHQSVGGRVSPTYIRQLVLSMQAANGRASPNQIRQLIMANSAQGSASPFPRPMAAGMTPPAKGMAPPTGGPPPTRTPMQQQPQHQQQHQQQQQQRFGSPMMQQRPMSPMMHQQRQGPPMMQQGRTSIMPFPPGSVIGGPHLRTPQGVRGSGPGRAMNTYLTPMHPHIPPMRPFSDPGLRRRYPFNNQQRPFSQTPNRYGDNRHQRPHHNRYNEQRRPGPGGDASTDDYANLMTQREKEWVQKIQLLQLQSNNPEVDDYYYQAYMQKKQGQEEQGKEGVQAEKTKKNGKESGKITPNTKSLETRVYQPAQYEGALGRVTSSSVNNPRQLIDFHIEAVGDEEEGTKPSAAKEQSKKRRTLLSIERVYGILLQLDDLGKQVLTLTESDRRTLLEKRQSLLGVVYAHLKPETVLCDRPSDDHFIQVLSVRKGRRLITRVLPLLEKKEAQYVVQALLRNMSLLLKKESQEMRKELQETQKASAQETLPAVFPPVWRCIQATTLPELTCMVKQLTAGASSVSPSRQYGSIISLHMQNKFGVSVILCLLSQGERIYSSTSLVDLEEDAQNDWVDCVNQFAKDICVVADTAIPQPLVIVDNVLPHFARFVSKQTFNALEKRLRSITTDKTS
ncbi:protein PAT1 homolog 1-like [Acanthaster planci]|uniref:Protein PAT1 homolog 1-like n=1 Tax=Acanthaster planci TaxID=133434 RepID=A0A8B7ZPJ6_ACAPL|nr:protein PAT1 homolog 1-like [Acanthaster planci]